MLLNKRHSLVIIDDHFIIIEGIKSLLSDDHSLFLLDTFTDGISALDFISKNTVDVVLLDISMPNISGIQLCKEIKKLSAKSVVLGLSNHSERNIVIQMLQSGANGYLLKNISLDELIKCIHDALKGELVFSNEIKNVITMPEVQDIKERPLLTKREEEVLKKISLGKTTTIIADELNVSPLTIETHRRNLMSKFNVKNVAELIMVAVKENII
ncbi:response regulator transcription factor [Chryseobacterium sp. Alg-005]|uniref:response regulator n=1 Tax=Chryseobacterium sp. Alg-005 TaxID=3159516 RepID=UPI0035559C36